ncbi:hypothetical protein RI367_007330 [Sorochytrium milnesiophthora]
MSSATAYAEGQLPVDPTMEQFARVPDLAQLDKTDVPAILRARDQHVREEWVEVMETHIIRERLSACYRREGVNYRQNCRHLALAYMDRLRRGGIRPWKGDIEGSTPTDANEQEPRQQH